MTEEYLTPEQIEQWRTRIRNTTFANYHLEMGWAMVEREEAKAGEAALLRALELAPDSAEAAFELVEALKRWGRDEEARHVERQAVAFDPDYRIAGHLRRLDNALLHLDFPRLKASAAAALKEVPDLADAVLAFAIADLKAGDFAGARERLDGLKTSDLRNPDLFRSLTVSLAYEHLSALRTSLAAPLFRLACTLDPENSDARSNYATTQLYQRDFAGLLETVVDLEKTYRYPPSVFILRALALIGLRREEEAIAAVQPAAAAMPGIARITEALAWLQLGNCTAASNLAIAAAGVQPRPPLAAVGAAHILIAAGRTGEAHELLVTALRQDPSDIAKTVRVLPIDTTAVCSMFSEVGYDVPELT